jgi:hypothetical protein
VSLQPQAHFELLKPQKTWPWQTLPRKIIIKPSRLLLKEVDGPVVKKLKSRRKAVQIKNKIWKEKVIQIKYLQLNLSIVFYLCVSYRALLKL